MITDIENIEKLIEKVKTEIRNFADIGVIGLSGGADSTLVAILTSMALGKRNTMGVIMPMDDGPHCSEGHSSAVGLVMKLGIPSQVKPIGDTVESIFYDIDVYPYFSSGTPMDNSAINLIKGNIQARARMTTLYTYAGLISNRHPDQRVRVIGTDNKSEGFIGYFTKYGDGGVDINPIGELYKSEVYQLLDYFKYKGIITEDLINRTPSAGLWEGQTDEGELGITYDELESTIRFIEEDKAPTTPFVSEEVCDRIGKVRQMNKNNLHKSLQVPIISLRDEFCA